MKEAKNIKVKAKNSVFQSCSFCPSGGAAYRADYLNENTGQNETRYVCEACRAEHCGAVAIAATPEVEPIYP